MNDTIADVIRAHRSRNTTSRHPRLKSVIVNITGCTGCDWRTVAIDEGKSEHASHVADAIRAALGLTEEWRAEGDCQEGDDCDHFGDHGHWSSVEYDDRSVVESWAVAKSRGAYLTYRLVSDWRPVDA